MMLRGWSAAAILLLAAMPCAGELADDYVSLALQGRLAGAEALFDADSLDAAERALAERFRARFVDRTDRPSVPGIGAFATDVVEAYRVYWTRALRADVDSATVEADLREALRAALAERDPAGATAGGDVLDEVMTALHEDGLHALGGRTLPFLELMLWAREDTSRFEVELDDDVEVVEVVFVRDFLVKGWSDWATFGRASTGGWATRERLFCLGDDYDLRSERFLVSYLKHEGRHFADYRRFPNLEQLDLEYRGKLTEIAWSDTTTRELLARFDASGAANPSAPHAWANRLVVDDVSRAVPGGIASTADPRWDSVAAEDLRVAARRLLAEHTASLAAEGAETRGVLRRRGG